MGFEKAVALEEILRTQLGAIGQERDPQKLFLLREIDRVFEQLRTVAEAAERIVDDEILQQNDKAAFGRADREEQVDHSDDGAVAAKNEDPAAIWFLENQPEPLKLLLFVRPEILLFAKQLTEKIRQFIQIFEHRRLNDDFGHGCDWLFHKEEPSAMRMCFTPSSYSCSCWNPRKSITSKSTITRSAARRLTGGRTPLT